MSIYTECLDAVASVSGAKKTVEVLEQYKDSSLIQRFMNIALDPSYNWYQSGIDPKAGTRDPYTEFQEDIDFFMDGLLQIRDQNKLRGSEGRKLIADLYLQVNEAERPLCDMIIERNLKSGCGAKTVSKVFGRHIVDVLPYMRCELFKHADGKKKATYDGFDWKAGIHSELKADGAFFNGIVDLNGLTVLRTRQGTPIPAVHQLTKLYTDVVRVGQAANLVDGVVDPVVHGEMLVTAGVGGLILYAGTDDEVEYDEGELLPREASNGLINRLLKTGEPLPIGAVVHAQVWDIIPKAEWLAGKGTVKRGERRAILERAIAKAAEDGPMCVELIPMRIVYSPQEAAQHFAEMTSQGLEGTVIKNPNGLFKDGNSKDQLKMKIVFEVDLEFVGFNQADQKGKYADLFGSLQLKSSDGLLEVGCSGMSVELRNQIFEIGEDRLKGKIFTVSTNGVMPASKHNNGVRSLFLPRLAKDGDGKEMDVRVIEHRLDKTVADTLPEIEAAYQLAILGSLEA